jgi:hypothetical protein
MLFSCITATSQSDTSYTAVYAAVGSFVVAALLSVIIFLVILRYDIIVFILALPVHPSSPRFAVGIAMQNN